MGFKLTSSLLLLLFIGLFMFTGFVRAEDDDNDEVIDAEGRVDEDIGKSREGSRTDDEVVKREEEQIKLDGLNVAQLKELREKAEKQQFVAEVNRMMKLIINSLYKNKEIFLRELISNASDALDKIRFLSLTDKNVLQSNEELVIRIKADKENRMLHITDTGIGMTKDDLIKYLGTIAKSETSEFLSKVQQQKSEEGSSMTDLIGQFGVGFYSAFLVADKVIVTSKNNNDEQYIWESDSTYFQVSLDPRGNTLGRGTTISLHMKEEAQEFLEEHKLKEIIKKYSQFINFNIYLWTSKTVSEEVPVDEDVADKKSDDDATVEEAKDDEKKEKTKKVDKTVWDWELMNESKPIWQRKSSEVTEKEYQEFYKVFSKDSSEPLTYTHFVAEGEVTFKSILYVPKSAPHDLFQNTKKIDTIKLYVRRVFITDTHEDLLPKYLNFVKGVVDSDDLPLNVSRETLQQNKLLKVIKKKLVRKILDMIKKLDETQYEQLWKEYGTNFKLGVIEDTTNRVRLAKLLRFYSSSSGDKMTSLEQYVKNMKDKQDSIYFIAGTSKAELEKSPFVEKLLKKGFEVLYLIDAIDEYTMQSLPNFEGKTLQNVAKDGVKLDKSKAAEERAKEIEKSYEPLMKWIKDKGLKDKVESVKISSRLVETPMALVASQYGYSGNMERITKAQAYQKTGGDGMSQYYFNQKKILEINPGHPLIKELLKRVEADGEDQRAFDSVGLMFESAILRSGYELSDSKGFADRIERMLRKTLDVSVDEKVEEEPDFDDVEAASTTESAETLNADEETTSIRSCGSCRKILGVMTVDGASSGKKGKESSTRETALVKVTHRRNRNREEAEEEEEEEEDNNDENDDDDNKQHHSGRKIILIKKVSPSKALFKRVIIKPKNSGDVPQETLVKVKNDDKKSKKDKDEEKSEKNDEHDDKDDKKKLKANQVNKKETEKDEKHSKVVSEKKDNKNIKDSHKSKKSSKDHAEEEEEEEEEEEDDDDDDENDDEEEEEEEEEENDRHRKIKSKISKSKTKSKEQEKISNKKVVHKSSKKQCAKNKNQRSCKFADEEELEEEDDDDDDDEEEEESEKYSKKKNIKSTNKAESKKSDKKKENIKHKEDNKSGKKVKGKNVKEEVDDDDDDDDDDDKKGKKNNHNEEQEVEDKKIKTSHKKSRKNDSHKYKSKDEENDEEDNDDDDDDDDIEEEEEEEELKHKKSSKKEAKKEPKTKAKNEEKKEKSKKINHENNDKDKKDEKKSKNEKSKRDNKHLNKDNKHEESKVTELTKQQLANFKGVWGLIKTIFTISNGEEIDENNKNVESFDDDDDDDKVIKPPKDDKHKSSDKGKRKLLSVEESESSYDDNTEKYVKSYKKIEIYGNKKNNLSESISENNSNNQQEYIISYLDLEYEIQNEDKADFSFQKRKLLSIDSKKDQDKKVPIGPKSTKKPAQKVAVDSQKVTKKGDESVILGTKDASKKKISKQEKLNKETVNSKPEGIQKPKVGWEYRYRISRYARETGNPVPSLEDYEAQEVNEAKSSKIENNKNYVNDDDDDDVYEKPNVGWEYRYRVSKWIEANPEKAKKFFESKKKTVKHESEKVDKHDKNDKHDKQNKNKKEVKKVEIKNEECDGNPNSIVFGRFRIDKNKVGSVGWEYRYRVSNKLKKILANTNGKTVDRGSEKLIPVEIVDYLDDPDIPYCDQVLDDSKIAVLSKDKHQKESSKKVKSDDDDDDDDNDDDKDLVENKPKVGWAYRYRISKWREANPEAAKKFDIKHDVKPKSEENNNKKEKLQSKVKKVENKKNNDDENNDDDDDDDDLYSPESKPKVGWEYRYRISRKIAAEGLNSVQTTKSEKEHGKKVKKIKAEKQQIIEEKTETIGENPNTHNIGWEYRYRLHRKLEALKNQKESDNSQKTATQKKEKPIEETKSSKKNEKTETPKAKEEKKAVKEEKKAIKDKEAPIQETKHSKTEKKVEKEKKSNEEKKPAEKNKIIENKAESGGFRQLLHNSIARFLPYSPKFIINVLCLHTDKFEECNVKQTEPEIKQNTKQEQQQDQQQQQQQQQKPLDTPKLEKKQAQKEKPQQKSKENKSNNKKVVTKITAKIKKESEEAPKVIFATEYKKVTKSSHTRIEKVPNKKDLKELEKQEAHLLQISCQKTQKLALEHKESKETKKANADKIDKKNSTAKSIKASKVIKDKEVLNKVEENQKDEEKKEVKEENIVEIEKKVETKSKSTKEKKSQSKNEVEIKVEEEKVHEKLSKEEPIEENNKKENPEDDNRDDKDVENKTEKQLKEKEQVDDKEKQKNKKEEKNEVEQLKEEIKEKEEPKEEVKKEKKETNKVNDKKNKKAEVKEKENKVEESKEKENKNEESKEKEKEKEKKVKENKIEESKEKKVEEKKIEVTEEPQEKEESGGLFSSLKSVFKKAPSLFDIESFDIDEEEEEEEEHENNKHDEEDGEVNNDDEEEQDEEKEEDEGEEEEEENEEVDSNDENDNDNDAETENDDDDNDVENENDGDDNDDDEDDEDDDDDDDDDDGEENEGDSNSDDGEKETDNDDDDDDENIEVSDE